MARPRKTAAESVIHATLPPPRDLSPTLRKIWLRDISSMPPGYFAPCDVPALRDYCDTRHEYMRVLHAMTRAKGRAKAFNAVEFRAVAKLLLAQMRALRMLPSTRLHKVTAGNLAAAPTLDRDDPRPGWRQIMEEAAGRRKPN